MKDLYDYIMQGQDSITKGEVEKRLKQYAKLNAERPVQMLLSYDIHAANYAERDIWEAVYNMGIIIKDKPVESTLWLEGSPGTCFADIAQMLCSKFSGVYFAVCDITCNVDKDGSLSFLYHQEVSKTSHDDIEKFLKEMKEKKTPLKVTIFKEKK